jgi:hypothetical protein
MPLLLSSGARPRYRDDILRALALPQGLDLQFRYDRELVADALVEQARQGRLVGQTGVICYGWVSAGAPPRLVPCRSVHVTSASLVGSSCVLILRVGGFVAGLTDTELRARLAPAESALLPIWHPVDGGDDRLIGKFVLETTADLRSFVTHDLTSFEQIATTLSRFTDFQQRGLAFFTVRAIFRVRDPATTGATIPIGIETRRNASPVNGRYRLQSGASYDAEIYTFAARRGGTDAGTKLHVTSDKRELEFPLESVRVLDSRYDLQRFRIATQQQITAIFAVLRIYLKGEDDGDTPRADILLPRYFPRFDQSGVYSRAGNDRGLHCRQT